MTTEVLSQAIAAEHERQALGQHAAIALRCKDACNLSGVAHAFMAAIQAVNDEAHWQGQGTDWRNNHPIVRLFVDRLASLCHMHLEEPLMVDFNGMSRYALAVHDCKILADE